MQITDNQLELRDGFTLDHEGKRITIHQDDNTQSPREWDNLGIMVCQHGKYQLGDEDHSINFACSWFNEETGEEESSDTWAEIKHQIEVKYKPLAILPLFLYDHSGITMYTTPADGSVPVQHQAWDSMQVGFIFTTAEKMKEIGVEGRSKAELEEMLRGEVKTYDQYLVGDIYGYEVEEPKTCECCGHTEFEHVDSCWGFYDKEGILEAINANFPIKVAIKE